MGKLARRGATGRHRLALGIVLLMSAGLIWGFGSALADGSSPSPAAAKITLKLGWVNDPDNLNPFIGYESSAFEIWHLNYDLLVGYAPDGSPRPELADSWETSADDLTWTFHLHPGITWQDGQPFTATDVAWMYNYIVDNKMAAFSAYTQGIRHCIAVDDLTLKVVCTTPKANMLRMWIPILPRHVWGKVSPQAAGTKYANDPPIIGTGPFQLVEVKKGEYYRMVANKGYWKGAPRIDEVVFQTYTNADTMAAELKAGTLDGAYSVPSAQFDALKATPGLQAIAYNTKAWEYLDFNCYDDPASKGNPVLKDPAFRRAVSWAIDRQKCATLGWSGHALPGTTIIPPGVWPPSWNAHYEPTATEKIGFDLEKAKQLLDEAGYADTNGDGVRDYKGKPIELRLWARSESQPSQVQGKLITDWFRKIGLKIDYQVMDDGAISDKLYAATDGGTTYAPDFDMYIWDWVGYADPGDTLGSFTTDQIWMWNDTNWSNKDYDALFLEQARNMDATSRLQQIHDMQKIFYDDAPELVIDYAQDLEAYDTARWAGWVHYPSPNAAVFYSNDNIDSYLQVHPVEGGASSGTSSTVWIGLAALAVAVIGGVALWTIRRRHTPAAVEE